MTEDENHLKAVTLAKEIAEQHLRGVPEEIQGEALAELLSMVLSQLPYANHDILLSSHIRYVRKLIPEKLLMMRDIAAAFGREPPPQIPPTLTEVTLSLPDKLSGHSS